MFGINNKKNEYYLRGYMENAKWAGAASVEGMERAVI
jgi:hypothetical protein